MSLTPKVLTERFEDFSNRLDWRWQRALALFSDKERPHQEFDDVPTVKCYKFLKAFQETENVSQRQLLRMNYPHEMRAYDYYLNKDRRRFRLEALSLCRDMNEGSIAAFLDEDPKVISLFEKFFFDVRGRKREAVYNALFPPNCFKECLGDDISDKIWKFFAMVGGFKWLNCLMNPYSIDEQSVNDIISVCDNQGGIDYGISCLIRPLDHRDDLRDIQEFYHRKREVDAKQLEAEGHALPDAQATILQKCIEATHVQVMDPDFKLTDGREPTVEELLAQGESAPVPVVS